MDKILLKLYLEVVHIARHFIRVVFFGGPAMYVTFSLLISWDNLYDYLRDSVKVWVIGLALLSLVECCTGPE